MGRIGTTIELAKSSWRVLRADKELLLLPVMSFVATIAVAASFLAPLLVNVDETSVQDPGPVGYALMFVAYLVLAFITIFFNAALVHAANERLEGGDPTVGSALRGAAERIGGVFAWSLVSATVSIVLRAVQERGGLLGRIAGSIAGIAWSLVTFLVIPVLVIERVPVGDAIKRSGTLFKRTWGENVAARVGFGLLGFAAVLPAILVAGLGIAAGGALALVAIAAAVIWVLATAMTLTALSGIFQTALYRHAAGLGTGTFGSSALQQAFAPKATRGFGGGFAG